MPSAFPVPSRPVATSLTVPSPPTATTMSALQDRAQAVASPAFPVSSTSYVKEDRSK